MSLRRYEDVIWLPIYDRRNHKFVDSGYFLSVYYDYYNNLGIDFNDVMGVYYTDIYGQYQIINLDGNITYETVEGKKFKTSDYQNTKNKHELVLDMSTGLSIDPYHVDKSEYMESLTIDDFNFPSVDGSYVSRLMKIQKEKLNVQFTNCDVTRPANENDKFIYPVYDKFNNNKLNTYIEKVTEWKTQRARFRLAAKRADIGKGFEYCYFIIGNNDSSKIAKGGYQVLPPSEISVFEFEIYKFTNEPPDLDDLFKKFIQRIDDLGYDLRDRLGPQILPKLWAANALNVHFTNYNVTDLPNENDDFIYPVLDLLTYGIEDYKKGWGKFADNLYYPYNYDVERVACKIVNTRNLYSPENGFTTYKVKGVGKDNLLFGDEVAQDPISAPITKLRFNESKRDLRTAQNAKFDGSTKRTVYIELLAVGAFSLIVGGVTIYISRDVLTTALMMAGVIVIGGISIVILNWNDISKKIKPIRETAGLVKYVL